MPDLIVIYGPPLSGKSTLARSLGAALREPAAVVSTDQLNEAIVRPDSDAGAELDFVHQQLRLLVANYLKFGYHCIVEGPFVFTRAGRVLNYEDHIDQLLALMRMISLRKMIIRLHAPESALAQRAGQTGRDDELASALQIEGAYKWRVGLDLRSYDTGAHSVEDIVASVLAELRAMPRGQS